MRQEAQRIGENDQIIFGADVIDNLAAQLERRWITLQHRIEVGLEKRDGIDLLQRRRDRVSIADVPARGSGLFVERRLDMDEGAFHAAPPIWSIGQRLRAPCAQQSTARGAGDSLSDKGFYLRS